MGPREGSLRQVSEGTVNVDDDDDNDDDDYNTCDYDNDGYDYADDDIAFTTQLNTLWLFDI